MNTFLTDIATLVENAGHGTEGETLFVHFMPHNVTRGVLIIGNLTGHKRDPYIPNYRRGKFQVIVRDNNRIRGEDLAWSVAETLTIDNTKLDGVSVKRIEPLHDPIVYPISDGSALEFSVNYEAIYAITN